MGRHIAASFAVLALLWATVTPIVAQDQRIPPTPSVPSDVLGPHLIAWSQLQNPQPVTQLRQSAAGPADAASDPDRAGTLSDNPLRSYEGVITDTLCGAKHSASIGKTAADCTRVCVHGGEQFALVEGDTVYSLEGDFAALKQLAGRRAKIVGTVNGNKLSVVSAAAAN
jgi:hypothetical protein